MGEPNKIVGCEDLLGRKGISPLIAAVLLIAFTMAVAAILTTWVTQFTKEQTEQIEAQSKEDLACAYGMVTAMYPQLVTFDTNGTNNDLEVVIQNIGKNPIMMREFVIYYKKGDKVSLARAGASPGQVYLQKDTAMNDDILYEYWINNNEAHKNNVTLNAGVMETFEILNAKDPDTFGVDTTYALFKVRAVTECPTVWDEEIVP